MATLEDKILGNKLHNYCSSSEDEGASDDGEAADTSKNASDIGSVEMGRPMNKWEGTSANTGPKGVIKDWETYKLLKAEEYKQKQQEKMALVKRFAMTVKSTLEEERARALLDDPDMVDLLDDDEFMLKYQRQKLKEMLKQTSHGNKFGYFTVLPSADMFLKAIDDEHKSVTIVVHIYDENNKNCTTMNTCLKELCKQYRETKFCAISSTVVGLSRAFKTRGVPALLAYKGGQLIGNFVQVFKDLGNEFDAEDVENFLVHEGILDDDSLLSDGTDGDSIDST